MKDSLFPCLTKSLPHLILYIDEGTHVELFGEGHAVIELDAMHSGVVKVEALQLQSQQVGKVQKPQALQKADKHSHVKITARGVSATQKAI